MRTQRHKSIYQSNNSYWSWTSFVLVFLFVWVGACAKIAQYGSRITADAGVISEDQAQILTRSVEAAERAFEGFTPEQEYYIGRAVGAEILTLYQPFDHPDANEYINLIGQSLALASSRPELFVGYRFVVLDSDEVNAFASPSGLVMITRGALLLADSEDAVAAILAHEIGHIEHNHGIKAIRTSRITGETLSLLADSARAFSGKEIAQLTKAFEDSIGDITNTMVNNGYSRSAEREADSAAMRLLESLGYDQRSLMRVLEEMDKVLEPKGKGFGSTHPPPKRRIEYLSGLVDNESKDIDVSARQERFERFMRNI